MNRLTKKTLFGRYDNIWWHGGTIMLSKRERVAIVLSSVIKDTVIYQSSSGMSDEQSLEFSTKLSIDILTELGLIDSIDEDRFNDVMRVLHEVSTINNEILKSIQFPYKNS